MSIATIKPTYPFLTGGGKMGERIRNYDWSQHPAGPPHQWPQSLRVALSILLRSQAPMLLFWGPDLFCFYNDACCLCLNGNIPDVPGTFGAGVWPETWPPMKPLIDQVLTGGEAVSSENQLISIYRNGKREDGYWTFSYSPVPDDSGIPAGVFVTCTESTGEAANLKRLEESNDQLHFAIEAAELATWDFDPIADTFTANHRYTEWFGIPAAEETNNILGLRVIADEDRERVIAAYQKALIYGSDSPYDILYTIRPKDRPERILRAKGKAWFNEQQIAYRFNGTLQDVTTEAKAEKALAERTASLGLAIEIGGLGIFNIDLKTNTGTYSEQVQKWFGLPAPPQPMQAIFSKVHRDDQDFVNQALQQTVAGSQNGQHDITYRLQGPDGALRYLRSIGQVQYDQNTPVAISGIIQDVTEQLTARRTLEQNEAKLRSIIAAAPAAIGLFMGRDLIVELPNQTFIDIVGKGHDIEGKPLRDVMPELLTENQPFLKILDDVYTSGTMFQSFGAQVKIVQNGVMTDNYYNITYTPLLDAAGKTYAILDIAVDVTGEVLARKALEESEQRFQNLIRDATVGIIVLTGEEMHVEVVNEAYGRLIGYTPEALLRKNLFDVIPDTEAYYRPLLDKVRQTGQPLHLYDSPYAVVVNGQRFEGFLNVVYQPYCNADGEVMGVMVLCHDVTEQVLNNKKLEQREQQIRSLIESAPFPIGVYVEREMKIELANQTMLDTWGKGNDVIGKRYAAILPELDNQEIFKQLDQVYTTGVAFHAKNQRVDLMMDGRLQPFYFNYSFTPLFDSTGAVYGVMNTAADVTDLNVARQQLQRNAENLRNMILQAPVAMCIFRGPDYVVEIANERMLEIWGKKAEEVLNKPTFEGIPEGRNQGYEEILEGIHKTGQPFSIYEMHTTLQRNGQLEELYVNLSYEPLKNDDGTVSGILVVGIEVTDQVRARRKIEDVVALRTKELEQANNALSKINQDLSRSNTNLEEFAYAASHDLKEPIRKIHFFSDRLRNSLGNRLTGEESSVFSRMEVAAKRMSLLIDDLLTYSQFSLRPSSFDDVNLNQLIDLVLGDLDLEIEERGAVIEVANLFSIRGHHRQLQQAFQNLISNALKYSHQTISPRITITCNKITGNQTGLHLSPEEEALEFYRIDVTDNGIGFEQKDAERIFHVFTRLHGNSEFRGTGIGLSIVRKVVENHKGYITAESRPNEGATFSVYLPVT